MKPNQPFLIAYPETPDTGFDELFNNVAVITKDGDGNPIISTVAIADGEPMGPYSIPAADGSDPLVINVYSDGDFNAVLPATVGTENDESFAVSGEVNTNGGGLLHAFAVYFALKSLTGQDIDDALGGRFAQAQSIQTPAQGTNFMVQVQFVPAQAGSN